MSRCKFCGSMSLHADEMHKNFSGGKAVAGAVVFGVVGAAAGFIGKQKKGYRCGNCGQFMEQPMDISLSLDIDKAIDAANGKNDFSKFNYYVRSYPAIRNELTATPQIAAAPALPVYTAPVVLPAAQAVPEQEVWKTKRLALVEAMNADSPVWLHYYEIVTKDNADYARIEVFNISDTPIRSVYMNIEVFDDAGDALQSVSTILQGLSLETGASVLSDPPVALMTNVAYRLRMVLSKVVFTNDVVWRNTEETAGELLPALMSIDTVLSPELRAQAAYDSARPYFKADAKVPDDLSEEDMKADGGFRYSSYCPNKPLSDQITKGRIDDTYKPFSDYAFKYIPAEDERLWRCSCGAPNLKDAAVCVVCGRDKDKVFELFDIRRLMESRRQLIIDRALDRAEKVADLSRQKQYDALTEKAGKADTIEALAECADGLSALGDFKGADKLVQSMRDCCAKAGELGEEMKAVEEQLFDARSDLDDEKGKNAQISRDLMSERQKLESELSQLGLFKRKEKLALREKIEAMSQRIDKARADGDAAVKKLTEKLDEVERRRKALRTDFEKRLFAWKSST